MVEDYESEAQKAADDAARYGIGFMLNGKRVSREEFYKPPLEHHLNRIERLAFDMRPPNSTTPRIVQEVIGARNAAATAERERDEALSRVEALDELLADAQSEARSHADAAENYAREVDAARALVRELVEAGENIVHEVCEGWCQRTPSHRRFDDCFGCTIEQRMIAKARDADYTEEGE